MRLWQRGQRRGFHCLQIQKIGGQIADVFFDEAVPKTIWPGAANSAAGTSCSCLNGLRGNVATAVVSIAARSRKSGGKLRTPIFFFDEAVAKTFWLRSDDFDAEASCSCLDDLRGNVAGAVVSIASRSRKSGGNCDRLIFFFDEAVPKTIWPGAANSAAGTSCSCLNGLRGNVATAVVSIAARSRKSGGKLRTPIFFVLTRPSPRLSGSDQTTSTQKLPAAALTTFVATLQAPWFPLPPGPENQGENCERLIFFFDEAVAKTFWPRSADFDAEASCSCLDDVRGNVAGAVVSIASRSRKSGGKLRTPNFFF